MNSLLKQQTHRGRKGNRRNGSFRADRIFLQYFAAKQTRHFAEHLPFAHRRGDVRSACRCGTSHCRPSPSEQGCCSRNRPLFPPVDSIPFRTATDSRLPSEWPALPRTSLQSRNQAETRRSQSAFWCRRSRARRKSASRRRVPPSPPCSFPPCRSCRFSAP